jgi:hypothetical protein
VQLLEIAVIDKPTDYARQDLACGWSSSCPAANSSPRSASANRLMATTRTRRKGEIIDGDLKRNGRKRSARIYRRADVAANNKNAAAGSSSAAASSSHLAIPL